MSALQIWRELLAAPVLETGWSARRVAAPSRAGVLVAIRKPDDVPALLIEVSTSVVPAIVEYPSAEGFQVVPEPMAPGPSGRTRLCLVLTNDRYRDVFAVLVDDVVADICGHAEEEDVVRGFLARLRVWQVFMRRHGPSPLAVEAQIGLAAELLFLRDHFVGTMPAQVAVAAWAGPFGAAQDFLLPQVAIEVKASTTPGMREVQISSLAQLDTRLGEKQILLCRVDLALASGVATLSLPKIISELRGILGPNALKLFEERLLEVGYLDAHEKQYEARQYRLRGMTFYSVSGAFPRIERSDVRDDVVSCSYVIDLSDCAAFELSATEVDLLIRGGASD